MLNSLSAAVAALLLSVGTYFWRASHFMRRHKADFPLALRMFVTQLAWKLQPLTGGAGINGARVVVYVNATDSAGDNWIAVGGQMGVNFADTTNEIDVSDKFSGRLGERLPGRAKASVSLDLNFQEADPAQLFLKDAYRGRELVMVQRFYRNTADTDAGIEIEEASGVIVDLSESHPDQDKSTISLEVSLSNDWVASS